MLTSLLLPRPFPNRSVDHLPEVLAFGPADHVGVFSGRSPCEELFADQTPAHVRTDDDEHLTNLVAAGGTRLAPSLFVSSHVQ
jgi:hypothetical protein